MTKWILAASAAALAITSPVLADRGGQGGGKGGQQAAKAGRGGGGVAKAQKVGGENAHVAKMDRGGGDGRAVKARGNGPQSGAMQRFADRGGDKKQGDGGKIGQPGNRAKFNGRDADRAVVKGVGRDDLRVRAVRADENNRFEGRFAGNGLIDGCPPGLAKKLNGCMPPGQAKKLIGTRWNEPLTRALLPATYRTWYPDNNDYLYRERDGYVYRIDRDRGLIDALFPMFANDGNYFTVGQPYPLDYGFYNVPLQYQPYFADTGDYYYRYGDGGIYQVNRSNGLVDGIVALLAGDLAVGQRLPMGYDVYNVPYTYRDRYYDSADNFYRYNDGYIYRVDPTTQLITAVISALI